MLSPVGIFEVDIDMDINNKRLVDEAKHSYAILLGFVGEHDSSANKILLKWPDAMDALIQNNQRQFIEDMAILMCMPIKIIALSLLESLEDTEIDYKMIDETAQLMCKNPIEVKDGLIRICNQIILLLRSSGAGYEYVKNMRGEKP